MHRMTTFPYSQFISLIHQLLKRRSWKLLGCFFQRAPSAFAWTDTCAHTFNILTGTPLLPLWMCSCATICTCVPFCLCLFQCRHTFGPPLQCTACVSHRTFVLCSTVHCSVVTLSCSIHYTCPWLWACCCAQMLSCIWPTTISSTATHRCCSILTKRLKLLVIHGFQYN